MFYAAIKDAGGFGGSGGWKDEFGTIVCHEVVQSGVFTFSSEDFIVDILFAVK